MTGRSEVTPPALAQRLAGALPAAGRLMLAESTRRAAALAVRPRDPDAGRREAAVLVLCGPGADGGGDVVLLERAAALRTHAGQVAFPGGGVDPVDAGDPVAAALREAGEEAGVVAEDVTVLGALPALVVPPRGTLTTPVLGWQATSAPVAPGDPAEVARVVRVELAALADPAARHTARTARGWTGPAFTVDDLVVWGFTGMVLSALLTASGLEQPWDATTVVDVPARFAGTAHPAAARERA